MGQSIQDMLEKLKSFIMNDAYFYTVLIVVVSILSFGLGRLSMQDEQSSAKPQIVLTEQSASVITSDPDTSVGIPINEASASLVASKKGTKYHLLSCPGASQMNDENKIYFASEEEAMASGYTKAKNCIF